MATWPAAQDWTRLRTFPLEQRTSLTMADSILVPLDSPLPPASDDVLAAVEDCADRIIDARARGAGVILMYGAHLLRNGAALLLDAMMAEGWLTHLATNGAGTIHDWEYAFLGRSTESVRQNVATGTFGAWDETGRYLHLAIMAGALAGEGYGTALGRFISEDGADLPSIETLAALIRSEPGHPMASAWADLLQTISRFSIPPGRLVVEHRWKHASILQHAFRNDVPFTVHPSIGYDIIANHPMFSGAAIGRGAGIDMRLFGDSVETLDNGVVLSIGSAIMAPQVFEKSLSCVNNLRLGCGRSAVSGHSIYVVDLQDGGRWDWTKGEPPKTSAAYYLRFCKSFARMGGRMSYVQCHNVAFVHHLYRALVRRRNAASG